MGAGRGHAESERRVGVGHAAEVGVIRVAQVGLCAAVWKIDIVEVEVDVPLAVACVLEQRPAVPSAADAHGRGERRRARAGGRPGLERVADDDGVAVGEVQGAGEL